MNPRQRILRTLKHKEPDKIPFDLGSTKVTGITRNAYINLLRYLRKNLREEEVLLFSGRAEEMAFSKIST